MQIWSLVQTGVLLYYALFMPVKTAFEDEMGCHPFLFVLELILDLYWFIDIVLNFVLGFKIDAIAVELRIRRATKRYLSRAFWVDLIISTPFTWITLINTGGICVAENQQYSAAKMLRLLRLTRVIRVIKLFNRETDSRKPSQVVFAKLSKLICGVGFLTHLFACGYWMIKVRRRHPPVPIARGTLPGRASLLTTGRPARHPWGFFSPNRLVAG